MREKGSWLNLSNVPHSWRKANSGLSQPYWCTPKSLPTPPFPEGIFPCKSSGLLFPCPPEASCPTHCSSLPWQQQEHFTPLRWRLFAPGRGYNRDAQPTASPSALCPSPDSWGGKNTLDSSPWRHFSPRNSHQVFLISFFPSPCTWCAQVCIHEKWIKVSVLSKGRVRGLGVGRAGQVWSQTTVPHHPGGQRVSSELEHLLFCSVASSWICNLLGVAWEFSQDTFWKG